MRFGIAPAPVQVWALAGPLLAKAIAKGADAALIEVMAEVDDGRAHLWIAHEADDVRMALVSQVADDGSFHLWLCGGVDMPSWIEFLPVLKAAAKDAGCDRLTIDGRRGWGRLLGWARAADGCWECMV